MIDTMKRIAAAAAIIAMFLPSDSLCEERDWSEIYLASHPDVSPDGSFFVFSWCGRIWKASTSGGAAVPLTDGRSSDTWPRISPDGRRVAFVSDRDSGRKLFEVTLGEDGISVSGLRQVSFHSAGVCRFQGYTPDGRWMLATARRDQSSESATSGRSCTRPILLPADGRRAEKVLFDALAGEPSISPDGTRVLFIFSDRESFDGESLQEMRRYGKGQYSTAFVDIWLYDIAAKSFSRVAGGDFDFRNPLWAPDGRGFYFLCNREGCRNVYYRSFDGGEDRQITFFEDDQVESPSLSRDGGTMVFSRGFDFWKLDLREESPVPVRVAIRPCGVDILAPRTVRRVLDKIDPAPAGRANCTFRNDGAEVAFTAGGDLWIMTAKDCEPVCMHGDSRTWESDCVFSPDGSVLYYLSGDGEGVSVMAARCRDATNSWTKCAEFSREMVVAADGTSRRHLSVSPDGRLLAWTDFAGRIHFADTNGAVVAVSSVASKAAVGVPYSWSPDSRYVAATLMDAYGNHDVWIIPSWTVDENGAAAPAPCNVSKNIRYDGYPAWSPDSRVLAFSGRRAATGDTMHIFYVYLDPDDESWEKLGNKPREGAPRAVFDGIDRRVRMTSLKGETPFFAADAARTVAFSHNGRTWRCDIPVDGEKKEKELLDSQSVVISWKKASSADTVLRRTDDPLPAAGAKKLRFKAYQTVNVADYQELAFLSGWSALRDGFYDPSLFGRDWPAVREKYRTAARLAPSYGVFARTMRRMYGDLGASHLGFSMKNAAMAKLVSHAASGNEWRISTAHTGARLDPDWRGEGWRVADVVRDSDADRGADGLLPGDIILSVDGRAVNPEMDVTEVLNVSLPHVFHFAVRRAGEEIAREIRATGDFASVRRLLRSADIEKAREYVRSKGDFGYLAIDAMHVDEANAFIDEVFAECFGKDGVVIDVRYNTGGFTADRLVELLCGRPTAVRNTMRGDDQEGYLSARFNWRPIISDMSVVVLANEHSQSNAEEFSHAMKTTGRAKLVGIATPGDCIGTVDFSILEYGVERLPRCGFFLSDGTDMECHGAEPDFRVELSPADMAAGRDPQLEKAVEVLAEDVASRKAHPLPPLKYGL